MIAPALLQIELAAKKHSAHRDTLSDLVANLNDQIETLKRRALPEIKRAVGHAAESKSILNNLISDAPDLFVRPRTLVFHGLKIGYRKGTGGIDWEDDERTVALIKRHFTKAVAETLIKTTEKPRAKALESLDIADLKRIGCTVESTGDVIVIAPTDTAVGTVDGYMHWWE